MLGWRRVRGGQPDYGAVAAAAGFLVRGPTVDVKLVAMQAGLFEGAVALRFTPLTLIVTSERSNSTAVQFRGQCK